MTYFQTEASLFSVDLYMCSCSPSYLKSSDILPTTVKHALAFVSSIDPKEVYIRTVTFLKPFPDYFLKSIGLLNSKVDDTGELFKGG